MFLRATKVKCKHNPLAFFQRLRVNLLNAILSLFQRVRWYNVGECKMYEIKLVIQRSVSRVSHAFRIGSRINKWEKWFPLF